MHASQAMLPQHHAVLSRFGQMYPLVRHVLGRQHVRHHTALLPRDQEMRRDVRQLLHVRVVLRVKLVF